MLLDKNTILNVTNRDNGTVGYKVPDLGVNRQFQPGETKELTMEELRKLSYLPGGKYLIQHCLVIDNKDAVGELLHEVEPEYWYTEADVQKLLMTGSLDQLKDCLDFAPKGVIELVKNLAVKLEINDLAKREAIYKATGLNINRAIANAKPDPTEEETGATKASQSKRRTNPISEIKKEEVARRTAPPRYNVVSSGK